MRAGVVFAIGAFGIAMAIAGHQIDKPKAASPTVSRAYLDLRAEADRLAVDDETVVSLKATGQGCGVELWAKKTLTDPGASAVNLVGRSTNIATLTAFPNTGGQPTRSAPVETQAWTLKGTRLVAYKQEPDSDYHLVLNSPTGATMIAEIPAPGCASGSRVLAQITKARADFVAQVGQPSGSYRSVSALVRITGIGFFDFAHGQRGVAPNAIELHPVIAFKRLT